MPGDRVPSIQSLAGELGVGLQTAHKAVRGLVGSGLLVSRPRHGTFVSHDAVERLRLAEGPLAGRVVTVVSLREREGMIRRMADEVESALTGQGARVVHTSWLQGNDWSPVEATVLPGQSRPTASCATVLVNPRSWPPVPVSATRPMVVISTAGVAPIPFADGFDVVTVDQEQGGLLAGRHFRQAGVKHPLFIGVQSRQPGGSGLSLASTTRLRGFELGFGATVPVKQQLKMNFYGLDAGAESVIEYLKLSPRPDGVFAASDELAVGFILGALAHGLKPGRDYRIIGFDQQALGQFSPIYRLDSVAVPALDMGRVAGKMLVERILNPGLTVRRISLGCSLTIGQKPVETSLGSGLP
jgi:hypothetical protein